MTPEQYGRVKAVYFRACELAHADRERFLRESCRDDEALLSEVRALLEYSNDSETMVGGLSDTNLSSGRTLVGADSLADRVGKKIGKYDVLRVLDSGGMGAVLEAYDATIDRRLAIKVLHPELAGDESMRRRFFAEARAAGAINHTNVATLFDVGDEAGLHYLVMEYAEEGSAADLIARDGALGVERATGIMLQACRGVAAAHSVGLVHRDLKPANLLLKSDGTVKVTDFGIAKIANATTQRLTLEGQIVGTPNYMSPEQCQGADIDARTDIYSLGATYYSLLAGRMPYAERKTLVSLIDAHCSAAPPDPREWAPSIPDACATIIRRAMAKAPADRYQSVEELIADLSDLDRVKPGPAARRRGPALAAAALAVLLLAALGAWMLSGGRDRAGVAAPPPTERPAAELYAEPPIRVGLLHALTGTMAPSETGMVDASRLAIDEINRSGGVLGRRVAAVIADGQSDERVFGAEARRLIEEEEVVTIFGCCTSDCRKTVKEVVEDENHLLIYPANHEGLETSPNIIYLGGDPSQTLIPCTQWSFGFGGMRSFFLVGSDYVYPRVANEILKDYLASLGGRVVGDDYLPFGSIDVGGVIDKIEAARPDAIINTISGDSQTAFVRTLRSRGLKTPQFTTGMGEQEVRNAGVSLMVGDYSVSTYFQTLDNPANEQFVASFHERFGSQRVTTAAMESAYAGVRLWAQAVESCGQVEPAAILQACLTQEVEAPSGTIRIDPASHYAYRRSYLGRIRPDGSFEVAWSSAQPTTPEPFPKSRTRAEWEALLLRLNQQWGGAWSAPAAGR